MRGLAKSSAARWRPGSIGDIDIRDREKRPPTLYPSLSGSAASRALNGRLHAETARLQPQPDHAPSWDERALTNKDWSVCGSHSVAAQSYDMGHEPVLLNVTRRCGPPAFFAKYNFMVRDSWSTNPSSSIVGLARSD